jgi:hypothetical protein
MECDGCVWGGNEWSGVEHLRWGKLGCSVIGVCGVRWGGVLWVCVEWGEVGWTVLSGGGM